MLQKNHIIYILMVLIFTACIDEFNPPSKGYENLLVVEGYLAEGNQEAEVKLSGSVPLNTT